MKKSTVLMIAMTVMMTSCGTLSQLASSGNEQRFQDGLYSNTPEFMSKAEKQERQAETDALIAKTKESPVYLYNDNVESPVARPAAQQPAPIKVTVIENPYDWRNNINPWYYYPPYSIGSSWWWSRHYDPIYWDISYRHYGWYNPFHYGRWHYGSSWYSPWYYDSWYNPWYYNSWYSPWYYDSWYNPWYYDSWHFGSWYNPYYGGWYGGFHGGFYGIWDPFWYHHRPGYPGYIPGHLGKPHREHYNTPRRETEIKAPNTPVNRTNTVRRGSGTSSTTPRGTMGQSSTNRRPTTTSGSNRNETAAPSNRPSGSNYRRPAVSSGSSSGSSSQNQGTVQRSSPNYDRGSSSSYDRGSSSSSYNRSYSTPSRSSGFGGGGASGGSYHRGGSSSGGGYSRGGSSGGARR